jgi:hypothetical protein
MPLGLLTPHGAHRESKRLHTEAQIALWTGIMHMYSIPTESKLETNKLTNVFGWYSYFLRK